MAKKQASDGDYSFAEEMAAGEVPTAEKLEGLQNNYRVYSTGSFMLDLAIGEKDPVNGTPGIPERSIVEIFGANQSFKSGTAEHLMKSVLDADPNNIVVALYAEEPDINRLEMLGVDRSRVAALMCYQDEDARGQMAEKQLDIIKRAVQDPNVKLVVIDSLKALCSVKQLFDERGRVTDLDDSEQLAIRAKLIGEFIRDFKILNKCAILFMTNQTSDKIQRGPWDATPNPQFNIQTPGGRAKEFEAHLRIEAKTKPIFSEEKHPLTQKELNLGWEVCYRVIKNKYSNSTGNRIAISQFYFEPVGFRRASEVFNIAEYLGIIKRNGPSVYVIGDEKCRGQEKALEYLEKNPKVLARLESEILERGDEVFSDNRQSVEQKTSAQV